MKLQDYLHYYLGCKMIRSSHWEPQNEPYILHFEVIKEAVEFGDRPILRRLEEMTEKEMIAMIQATVPDDMEFKPVDDEYVINMFYGDGGNLVDERVAVGAEISLRCFSGQVCIWKCGTLYLYDDAGDEQFRVNDPKAFHYLLQQQFDLFGLIDAGVAIDAKTIKS